MPGEVLDWTPRSWTVLLFQVPQQMPVEGFPVRAQQPLVGCLLGEGVLERELSVGVPTCPVQELPRPVARSAVP